MRAVPPSGLAVVLLLSLTRPLPAQTASTPPPACQSAEHRQFDFWIGEWDVTLPNGKKAGTNRIQSILNGCVLQENWTGAGGMTGTSYNIYDASGRRWHQTWVDDTGGLLELNGGLSGDRMILSSEGKDSTGAMVMQRITWEPTGTDQVRQLWESSEDGGKSWKVVFDGRYRRQGTQ